MDCMDGSGDCKCASCGQQASCVDCADARWRCLVEGKPLGIAECDSYDGEDEEMGDNKAAAIAFWQKAHHSTETPSMDTLVDWLYFGSRVDAALKKQLEKDLKEAQAGTVRLETIIGQQRDAIIGFGERLRALEAVAEAAKAAAEDARKRQGFRRCTVPGCEACRVDKALAVLAALEGGSPNGV